jgi:ubiquinone/menaquinone biosynthesis C-methylase UbiE
MQSHKRKGQPITKTSWNEVAGWYNEHLNSDNDSYHARVVIPGTIKLLKSYLLKGAQVLDLACGQGIFAREATKSGFRVTGIDIAPNLIKLAQQASRDIKYYVADAKRFAHLNLPQFDAVVCILALQNIDDISKTFSEIAKVLKPQGLLIFVINHPSFRIPRQSGWEWDEDRQLQYRRIDRYMSDLKIPIVAHPGKQKSEVTWSFHRPLQSYISALSKNKFSLIGLEEWISHKTSEPGPKATAENIARNEFPLFMCITARKVAIL